jgi:hypothetical protein
MRYKKINRKIFQKKKFNFEKNRTLKIWLLAVSSSITKILYRIGQNKKISDLVYLNNDVLYFNTKIKKTFCCDVKTNFIRIGIINIKIDSDVITELLNYMGLARA